MNFFFPNSNSNPGVFVIYSFRRNKMPMLCQALLEKLKCPNALTSKGIQIKNASHAPNIRIYIKYQNVKCKITNLFSWANLPRRADLIDTNRHHIPGPRLHLTEESRVLSPSVSWQQH